MSAPFVAEIRIFACNFAPTGWAFCAGQLLPISQNTALFSLLGTMYGGDGKSTFALPDFQGNCSVGQGQSTTGTQYFIGEESGAENVTLLQAEIPVHTHQVQAQGIDFADINAPAPTVVLGKSFNGLAYQPRAGSTIVNMNFQTTGIAGGSLPHNNMMPFLVLNFCIALQGVFPPRS
jgi:microcystin-dependent protein